MIYCYYYYLIFYVYCSWKLKNYYNFVRNIYLFTQQTTVEVPGLKPGMKLEAVDRNNPPSFCVATVIQKVGQRVRIRYDGFGKDSSNDHWCNFQAEELHPIGWCAQNGYPLQPPKGK